MKAHASLAFVARTAVLVRDIRPESCPEGPAASQAAAGCSSSPSHALQTSQVLNALAGSSFLSRKIRRRAIEKGIVVNVRNKL